MNKILKRSVSEVGCYDCGLSYSDPGFADLVVPHEVWMCISPTGNEGGLFCPTCLIRALQVAGFEGVRAIFRSGPTCLLDTSVTDGLAQIIVRPAQERVLGEQK